MNIIITFIALSIINVTFSTVRSIATIKSGKIVASLLNASYFAFYNIMLIYAVADFSLVAKCIITFACNLIGVFIVKLIEEKMQKDKLWKIEATFNSKVLNIVDTELTTANISHSYIENIGKHCIFNIYAETQEQSTVVKNIIDTYGGRYFASETKLL